MECVRVADINRLMCQGDRGRGSDPPRQRNSCAVVSCESARLSPPSLPTVADHHVLSLTRARTHSLVVTPRRHAAPPQHYYCTVIAFSYMLLSVSRVCRQTFHPLCSLLLSTVNTYVYNALYSYRTWTAEHAVVTETHSSAPPG